MGAITEAIWIRKKASSRGHHKFVGVPQRPLGRWVAEIKDSLQNANARTNFELPESGASNGANNKHGGASSNFRSENPEPFCVCMGQVLIQMSLVQLRLNCLRKRVEGGFHFSLIVEPRLFNLVLFQDQLRIVLGRKSYQYHHQLEPAAELSRMNGSVSTTVPCLASNTSNTYAKSVVIPNHDHVGSGVNSHQLCHTPPMTNMAWSNAISCEFPWPMQMSQVPENAANFTWPLSEVAESTVDMTYTDQQGPSSSIRNGQTNMGSMQLPLVGGATEGFWTLEQQRFLQSENNGWFSSNCSLDPLLYVPSELA